MNPAPASSDTRRMAQKYLVPFIMVTVLFFLWGFCHAMLDVMNKYFQGALDISKARSGLLQTAVYGGYFLMALPAGLIMRRLGYQGGILVGLALVAAGAFLFIPASNLKSFEPFLIALFILACGLTCLETAANPYVTVLGSKNTAASRLVLSQSFNAVGWILGPMVGGLLLFGSHADPYSEAHKTPVGPAFDALPASLNNAPLPPGFVSSVGSEHTDAALRELIAYAAKPDATRRGLAFRVVDESEAVALNQAAKDANMADPGIKPGYVRAIDSEALKQVLKRGGDHPLSPNELARLPALSIPSAMAGAAAADAQLSDNTLVKFETVEWENHPAKAKLLMVKLYNFSSLLFPYLVLGFVVLVVFIGFFFIKLPDITGADDSHGHGDPAALNNDQTDTRPLLARRHFTLGVLAQFLYVAGQTAVNAFALNFIIENQGGSETQAAYLLSIGLIGFAAGRFTGSAILRVINPPTLLALYGFINVVILGLVMANLKPASSMILLTSWFFMSIMFPTIFALSLRDLGAKTKIASSILVMSIVGGAIAPPIMGLLADQYGMAACFVVPLLCFAYVGVYGLIYPKLIARGPAAAV